MCVCVLVGNKIDKRFVQRCNDGFACVNERIWGDKPRATSLCPGNNTQASALRSDSLCPLQHEEQLSTREYLFIRSRTHHEVQVLIKQAESFRIFPVFFLFLLRVGSDKPIKSICN